MQLELPPGIARCLLGGQSHPGLWSCQKLRSFCFLESSGYRSLRPHLHWSSLGPGLGELTSLASRWVLGDDQLELNWAPTSMRASGHGHFTPQCPIFPIIKKRIIESLVLKREEKEGQSMSLGYYEDELKPCSDTWYTACSDAVSPASPHLSACPPPSQEAEDKSLMGDSPWQRTKAS